MPQSTEAVAEVQHGALRVVPLGADCARAVVPYTDPSDPEAVAPLKFEGVEGRCSARLVRAADVSRMVPVQSDPTPEPGADYRIAVAFTSAEAMQAWRPFAGCVALDQRDFTDDWAVADVSRALAPSEAEPTRVLRCGRAPRDGTNRFLLYYDASLLVVAVSTPFEPNMLVRAGRERPEWARPAGSGGP
jgi:hypothetical protein